MGWFWPIPLEGHVSLSPFYSLVNRLSRLSVHSPTTFFTPFLSFNMGRMHTNGYVLVFVSLPRSLPLLLSLSFHSCTST